MSTPGRQTLTLSLTLQGAFQALNFYPAAFDAVEHFTMPDGRGGAGPGEFQIGAQCV